MRTTLCLLTLASALLAQDAAELVKKLAHEEYEVREKATRQLIELGDKALPALEEALKSEDLEVRMRAGRAMRAITGAKRSEAKAPSGTKEPRQPGDDRPAPPRPRATATTTKIEFGRDGGVKVTLTQMRDGKQETKVYQGKSLEELKKNHPELARALGGVRLGLGRNRLDTKKFWRDFGRDFDDDWMKNWEDDFRRDMQRFQRYMKKWREQNGLRTQVPSPRREAAAGPKLGVRARRPESVLDAQLGLRGRGVVIEAVEKGSLADTLGMKRFDILLKLNGLEIGSIREVARAMTLKPKEGANARVIRRGKEIELKEAK